MVGQDISNLASYSKRVTDSASKATILVALLFLSPLLAGIPTSPDEDAAMMTSGRSLDPDVAVTDLHVTTPSVLVSGVPTLAPENHIIRVGILNIGGSVAEGNVTLKVDGVLVDNRTVTLNPGAGANHLLYWDASSVIGSGLQITASWEVASSSSDSNSSNDVMSLNNVNVVAVEDATDIADSLPADGSSLARAMWVGAITAVNTGNQPVDVTAQLTLTPSLGGSTVSLTSSTEQLLPGSLASPPTPQNITISFDGSNLEGDYSLGGSLLVAGVSQQTVTIESRIVNFVALRASLLPANNRNVDPGSQTVLNFILQNSGTVSDDFEVLQSNNSAPTDYWVNASDTIYPASSPLTVAAGDTEAIQINVDVPSDASNGDSVLVTVSIQSQTAGYVLEATTMVMAGGTYSSEIFQNHSHQLGENYANLTPGSDRTLEYTLKNTGTAPAQYQIDVGATEAIPFWNIHSPVTITDVLLPNETRAIPVTISTPHLEMPLNPSWKVSSIEQVDLIVQAIPMEGGVPSTNQTTLLIDSIVELDISVTGGANDITVDDIIAGNFNRWIDFEVTIVHNLGSNDTLAQVSLTPSIGNGMTFQQDTPLDGSSPAELQRWTATAAPSTMELEPGEIGYGKVALAFNPNPTEFPYPSAGTLTFSFKATSDWGTFPGTISRNATASVSVNIEEIWSAEMIASGVAVGDPGTSIVANLTLKNTGNDVANFTLGYVSKTDWTISLASSAANLLQSRTNLFPDNGSGGRAFQDQFEVVVTAIPPSSASADEVHEIWVYANSTETGELLAYAPALIRLTEVVSAEFYPTQSTAIIASSETSDLSDTNRVGQKTIITVLNNTGNTNITYDLALQTSDGDKLDVCFSEAGACEMNATQLVPPGSQGIVRVYAKASLLARADVTQSFNLTAHYNGTLLSTSEWRVQVAPDHRIDFIGSSEFEAAPGNSVELEVTMINRGNLMETLNLTADFGNSKNWTYTVNESAFTIEPESSHKVMLTITLPNLNNGGEILEAYVTHNITLRAVNITDPFPTWPSTITVNGTVQSVPLQDRVAMGGGVPAGSKTIRIEVLPVFDVQLIESPERIAIVPGVDREAHYVMENRGNAQMELTVQWETEDLDLTMDRFGVANNIGSTSLTLGVGQTSSFMFTFSALGSDHWQGETGSFTLIRTPVGIDVDPQQDTTQIVVVRAQTDEEYQLSADTAGDLTCVGNSNPNCRQIEIPWTNINSWGNSSDAERVFTLALNGKRDPYDSAADEPERLVPSGLYSNVHWGFNIDIDPSNDQGMCFLVDNGNGIEAAGDTGDTCNSAWDLEPSTPYDGGSREGHGGTITIQVTLPDKTNLAPGDGWDIYLQLRNPQESTNTEYSTDLVVKLRMSESTDPLIEGISIRGDGKEGDRTWVDVSVINAGNAVMPTDVDVTLQCSGTRFATIIYPYSSVTLPPLGPGEQANASWEVQLNPIPWYSSSESLECTASLVFPMDIIQQGGIFGNILENDEYESDLSIKSWTMPSVTLSGISLPSAALAALAILFLALSLLRQGLDEAEGRLHASAYVAAMGFGALSLTGLSTWLTLICAMASVAYAGLVAWLSSSELQAIHDDRKKSRIGSLSLLEDHDKEQKNTRNELRAIISCAPYAFLPFVLVTPALEIDMGSNSILAILSFMVISPILVHTILRFLDSSYDTLYSQLADIELRSIRIKKILGRAGNKPGGGS
ncbi:MAG: hypothetical protein ACJZ67_00875 [Candidatus Thalassarchaeaceae archaeon]